MMVKGSSKEEKRKQKKAKKYEDYHDKNSERETLPKGLKRGLTSDDENCRLDDGKRDTSNKERKKRKKDRGDNNAEDKGQYEGKQKERQDKLKSRERPQELASTESSELDSLRKKKRRKESRGNDSYYMQNEEEHDKREYSKGSHDKSLKELEPTLDVLKKRKKKKHDKNTLCDEHQIGDLENISDINNDDNETDNIKKKKKRKKEKESHYKVDTQSNEEVGAEMVDTSEVTGNEETSIEGKKKKKKSKQEPGEESRSAVHPAIDYLHTWHNNRKYWNFRKVRQVWLLKNMFTQEQVGSYCQV